MSGNVFRHSHRVTYAECTVGNHVYYARYLDFLEEARGEFFRSLGVPLRGLQEADTAFPAVESRLQYKSPARYDDVLRIELWLTELDRIRISFGHRIINQAAQLVVEGGTVHVCTTLKGSPKRLPGHLIALLVPYLPQAASVAG